MSRALVLLREKREWDEAEHPRDEEGKFTDAGGSEGGGGSKTSTVGTSSSKAGKQIAAVGKFDSAAWYALGMKSAREQWKKLSREEKDSYANARVAIAARIKELTGGQPAPNSGSISKDIRERVDQLSGIIPASSHYEIINFVEMAQRQMSELSDDDEGIHDLTMSMIDHLAAQEFEAMGRTLGDHGVHHIEHNIEIADELLALMPSHVDTSSNRALMTVAAAFHDAGYLTEPSRVFLDADHPRWAVQHYQENAADKVSRLFGKNFSDMVTVLIATHGQTDIDWEHEPEQSAFSVADNLSLFHEEKMPPLLREVHGTTRVLVDLARGKINVDEARKRARDLVEASDLEFRLKEQALHAASEITGVLPKYTLGMMGASLGRIEWKVDHPVINVERHPANEELAKVVDCGQAQFEKLAETYGSSGKHFLNTGHFEFKSKSGKVLLEGNIVPAGGKRAAPSTLYVRRDLINAEDVIDWFKGQGFTTTLPPEDMHVTVAFSKAKMDWPETLTEPVIVSGGEREMLLLGKDEPLARVMAFEALTLHDRWQELKDAGASWDWPEYHPHVTISYEGAPVDLDLVEPYPGALVFGPEIFQEIDEGWKDQVVEREFDEADHPRDETGKFTDAGGSEGSSTDPHTYKVIGPTGQKVTVTVPQKSAAKGSAASSKKSGGKSPPVVLWHGTIEDNWASIKANGLQRRHGKGADAALVTKLGEQLLMRMHMFDRGGAKVYASVDRTRAEEFANTVAEEHHTTPILIRLEVPRADFARKFRPDESTPGGGVRTRFDIPPEWIKERLPVKSHGTMAVASEAGIFGLHAADENMVEVFLVAMPDDEED